MTASPTPPVTMTFSADYLKWQLGDGHPTNPERALRAVKILSSLASHPSEMPGGVAVFVPFPSYNTRIWLERIHYTKYIDDVIAGYSDQWSGYKPDLAQIALLLAEGTRDLVHRMREDRFAPAVYFNPMGAKHHAAFSHSSGFCVFNDFAAAADVFTHDYGKRVAILDWDAHHGDGTEELLRNNPMALTISIHDRTIFPGTGTKLEFDEVNSVINLPVQAGGGDNELMVRVSSAIQRMRTFNPHVIMVAAGADGHVNDPLSTLQYTHLGFARAAAQVGRLARELQVPVLIGGAGGYRPLDDTPQAWATVVAGIQRSLHA